MNLHSLPLDLLENTILYYLGEFEILKLSHLNRGLYSRLANIRILLPHRLQWPNLSLKVKQGQPPDQSIANELKNFSWKLSRLTIDGGWLQFFQLANIPLPTCYQLEIDLTRVFEQEQIGFINTLSPSILHLSHVPDNFLEELQVERMPKLVEITLQRLRGDTTKFINRLADTSVSRLTLRRVFHDMRFKIPFIRHLDLSQNRLTPSDFFALSQSISSLYSLDLCDTKLDKGGLRHIVQVLPNSSLNRLVITKNDLYPNDLTDLFNIIHLTKLKEFEYHGKLGSKALPLLIQHLGQSHLQKLYLEIPLEQLDCFLKACMHSKVQDLTLIKSFQGDKACQIISQNIKHLYIKRLGFSLYNITFEGFAVLFKALQGTSVKQFYIDQGDFCNKALELIGEYLPLTNIEFMSLQSNNYDGFGVCKLAVGLQKIRKLQLGGKVSKKGVDEIVKYCANMQSLEIYTPRMHGDDRWMIKKLYYYLPIKI